MKKLLLMVLLCLPVVAMAGEDFDRGYALGFKEGYLKVEGQLSIAPICPIPPIPGIGEDTFFGGYNQGFIDGMAEAGVKLKNEDGEDIEPE